MAMYHAYFTIVLFVIMVGIIVWAYSSKRQQSFHEAANLPFADEPDAQTSIHHQSTDQDQDQGARS